MYSTIPQTINGIECNTLFASYGLILNRANLLLWMGGGEKSASAEPERAMALVLLFSFPFLFVSRPSACMHVHTDRQTDRQTVISWCMRDCVCENGHGGLCQLLGWLVRAQLLYECMHPSDVDESAYEDRVAVNQDLVSLYLFRISLYLSICSISLCLYLLPSHPNVGWAPNPRHRNSLGSVPEKQTATQRQPIQSN
ncbi:hypothetical protein CI102_15004 [Trichoderma harzianum]|nr:hypothetical protein CI102_15004 [Trichoderma harzianum]